jgi:cobalt-zinc-cadmium efflux system protein
VHAGSSGLKKAFLLNIAIVGVVIVGGLLANSLALLGDAAHNAADALAVGLAWFAQVQSGRPTSNRMTYGYRRVGILVALVNAVTLIAITLWLGWEAYERILQPEPIEMLPLFFTGLLGLAFNSYAAWGLRKDPDINVRGAFLHLLSDAAASAAVIVGGVVMLFTDWYWVDPVLSVLISLLIAFGAWDVLKKAVRVLMEGTPEQVDPAAVARAIGSTKGVHTVHDLHLWSIDVERIALSCHVVVDGARAVSDTQPVLDAIAQKLRTDFGIQHATIQLEADGYGYEHTNCGAPLAQAR